jgi:hypothetical protein
MAEAEGKTAVEAEGKTAVEAAHDAAKGHDIVKGLLDARADLDAFVLSLATTGESGGRFSTIRNVRANVKDEHIPTVTLAAAVTGDSNVKKVAALALALHSANRTRKGR